MTLEIYMTALAPEIALVVAGCICLFLGLSRSSFWRGAVAPFAFLAVAGVLILTRYLPEHGLTEGGDGVISGLSVGLLSLYVRWITLCVGMVLVLVNWYQADASERGEYFAMVLFSMAGVMLTASSNDLLMLFFALELVSVPTYILVALSRKDIRAQEACAKYFFLGALAAALTAYGFSFLFGVTGETALFGPEASVAARLSGGQVAEHLVMVGFLLSFGGLCFKIAAVPFHGYVADVYQGAAAPLAGLLAFVPKLAGFVGLIKLFSLMDWQFSETLLWTIWIVAAATMTAGNVLALMQSNVKRMLAYSSVAHSGYMLVGLLVGPVLGATPLSNGLGAMLFYMAVYGLMNLGAFAVLSYLSIGDKEVEEREQLAGLSRHQPFAAAALAVCLFSLMGLPPTAGFLGKVYIFSSAFSMGQRSFGNPMIWLAVIGVLNSAVGVAYYLRVVGVCYLRPPSVEIDSPTRPYQQVGAAVCALMMLVLFVFPENLIRRAAIAAFPRERLAATQPSVDESDFAAAQVQPTEQDAPKPASESSGRAR